MNLDPKQTEAFRFVIKTGSFEQAALRLHLTPPAISQRVRAVESALGSALVVRSRPCRPTETDQRLLQYLKRATLLEADLPNWPNVAMRRWWWSPRWMPTASAPVLPGNGRGADP